MQCTGKTKKDENKKINKINICQGNAKILLFQMNEIN